jgi:pimeloyl-ACP methyl ester carboxylesterase
VQFKSLVLVHGAGSDPSIFKSWRYCFGPIDLRAVDLLADIDVDSASMADYAEAVEMAALEVPEPKACCGWSMGGLVAMMAQKDFDALILIEPSPPAELQGYDPQVLISPGNFDPEEVYGQFPIGIQSRPESSLARAERKERHFHPVGGLPIARRVRRRVWRGSRASCLALLWLPGIEVPNVHTLGPCSQM